MKKLAVLFVLFALVISPIFYSCEKDENGTAPELPPLGSLEMNLSAFQDTKTGSIGGDTYQNYTAAGWTILFWNIHVYAVSILPVTAFAESFKHEATFVGDATWKWEYDVPFGGNTISARLEGKVLTDSAQWKMYLSYDGTNGYEDFLWFEGFSALDRSGGWWKLYEGPESQDELIKVDWAHESDSVASLKYTFTKPEHDGTGNYIMYEIFEIDENNFDSRYTIFDVNKDKSAIIEWNSTTTEGRINKFDEDVWSCWDANHVDIDCN